MDLGTIFWGIVTFHPCNLKVSLMTTGNVYVHSHYDILSETSKIEEKNTPEWKNSDF